MALIFNIVNGFFGILFYPFDNLNPAWGMIWISLVTGILMLIVFRFTSNQLGIKKAKAKVNAYILEMRLFNHDLGRMLSALGKTFLANFSYLRYMFVPLIFIIIPVLITLIQMNYRYENRPIQLGEHVVVKATLKPDFSVLETPVSLQAPEGIIIETPALRTVLLNELDWRISAPMEGEYKLDFEINGKRYKKNICVGNKMAILSVKRVGSSFSTLLLNHSEPKLPEDSPFASLEVMYPKRVLKIIGLELHWIIWFLIFSIIFAFIFKKFLRVEL